MPPMRAPGVGWSCEGAAAPVLATNMSPSARGGVNLKGFGMLSAAVALPVPGVATTPALINSTSFSGQRNRSCKRQETTCGTWIRRWRWR